MEFLNVGPGELLALALIGLILFGPEDLLRIAQTLGGYVRSARQMWQEIASQIEVNLADIDATPPASSSSGRADNPTKSEGALSTSPQMSRELEAAEDEDVLDEQA